MTDVSMPLEVTVGGTIATAIQIISVTIQHGRRAFGDQPDATMCRLELDDPTGSWPSDVQIGDELVVRVNPSDTWYDRFKGRVTQVQAAWGDPSRPRCIISASGILATLGRTAVGDIPWPAELDGARIVKILDAADVAAADRGTLDAGIVTVLPRDVDKQAALPLCQGVATDARGFFFDGRDGKVNYHDAEHRRGAATAVSLTLGDLLIDSAPVMDLNAVTNEARVRYGAGDPQAEVTVIDQVSIDERGRYDKSISTQLADATDALSIANQLVVFGAVPRWTLAQIGVELLRNDRLDYAILAKKMLALECSSLVELLDLPPGPIPDGYQVWVEGWSESIRPYSHAMTLYVTDKASGGVVSRWIDINPATTWATTPADLAWLEAGTWYG